MTAPDVARHAAGRRLLNAYLRETGVYDVPLGPFAVPLPATGGTLPVEVVYVSPSGHHDYGDLPDELTAAVLAELEASTGHRAAATLGAQIEGSVAHTARFLARGRRAPSGDLTRHSEQNILFGHPFHPTPKSSEGFSECDLDSFAPELGVTFVPHYFAVARELVIQRGCGEWDPEEVLAATPSGYVPLPAHPWQARYLLRNPSVRQLAEQGGLISLGALGPRVYPTSSVRTVCAPDWATSWKLPLHVRITNFVRNTPLEHLARAMDAAAVVAHLPPQDGFGVVRETGYRVVDPAVIGDDLAAELNVLYRENPAAGDGPAPRVLAGLLDDPDELVRCVRQAGDVVEWLRCFVTIAHRPLLSAFAVDGVSFEAHVQNSLLCLDGGRPVRFLVRDLEGVAISRSRVRHGELPADSPALYDDAEAWLRLRYHAFTNQLAHVIHVLGRYTDAGERLLWTVAREELSGRPEAADLLDCPTLPAKANLVSRFTGRGEHPLFVDIPNPLRELP